MNGFSRLAFVETNLFLREKAATLAVFGLPVALVIGFGLVPGFNQPQKSLSDQIGTEYIAALGVAIVLATLGLNGVPMVIGQYREQGILRRLGVTPVRPLTLLLAKLAVWAASAIVSVAFVVAVVRVAFHVPMPQAPGWFVLSVLLGIGSVFALGMVAAAAARPPAARPGSAGCCSSRTCSWPVSTSRPRRCRRRCARSATSRRSARPCTRCGTAGWAWIRDRNTWA